MGGSVTVPFGRLFIVFGLGKQKSQYLFWSDAGYFTFAKLDGETEEDKLTGFDGIFFFELAW